MIETKKSYIFKDGNNEECVKFRVGERAKLVNYIAVNSSPYVTVLGFNRLGYYVVEFVSGGTMLYGLSDKRLEKVKTFYD